MKRLKTLSMTACMVLVLAGCHSLQFAAHSQPSAHIAIGGQLALNETIEVRRHYARSIIQNGEVVRKPDLYTPWCTVHVYRSRSDIENKSTIDSGTFDIRNVYHFVDYTASLEGIRTPVQIVHNGSIWFDDRDEPSNVTFSTVLELVSDAQPAVTKMVCSIFDDPRWGRAPTLTQIAESLGELAELSLPQ